MIMKTIVQIIQTKQKVFAKGFTENVLKANSVVEMENVSRIDGDVIMMMIAVIIRMSLVVPTLSAR